MFKSVPTQPDIVSLEQRILQLWSENKTFAKSLELRADAPRYVFFEGPPTANAPPGLHHILARVVKDLFLRYNAMKGKYVLRKGGWDTHGLPVEVQVEKEIGSRGKRDIEKFGIAEFIKRCRNSVWNYIQNWNRMTERIGFWVDLNHAYITYTNDYIESGWHILKTLWERGLLFKDFKVSMHCPRCCTSLSDAEAALGYRDDTDDPSVWVRFKLKNAPSPLDGAAILAWTTTPWTLPANVALAVNAEAEYLVTRVGDEKLIIAETRANDVLGGPWEALASVRGQDLVNLPYENLFNGVPAPGGTASIMSAYHVIADESVSLSEGTGIVHIAPAYGDLEIGRRNDLPTLFSVDLYGNMMPELGDHVGAGKFFKDADVDITRDLQNRGLLFRAERVKHTYPFCWRCEAPLLYYAKSSWYIKTTAVKERLLTGNNEIHWFPEHIRRGRFGDWLENNVDWAISRERYWGTPLPIWQDAKGHLTCVGSIADLKARSKNADTLDWSQMDLHRPWVDGVILKCDQCGADMKRLPEVIDCWFDSGAMPYAQWHYPFENQDTFEDQFPADFISEAIDQTRGWFYSLHALGILLKDTPVYRNCVVLGHVVDKDGQKMSKSKGNMIDPWYILNNYGADPVRWYFYRTTSLGNPYRFSESTLQKEVVGGFLNTVWNTYAFFVTYANADKFSPFSRKPAYGKRVALDLWILAELHATTRDVDTALAAYDMATATRQIEQFVEDLSNWYVRRSRRRFWKGGKSTNAQAAYHTLYECLVTLSKLLAPFTPFIAEEIYQNLARQVEKRESVHHTDFPMFDAKLIDDALITDMNLVVRVATLGRAARSKAKRKVRQPLARVLVKTTNAEERIALEKFRDQLLDELNVKELVFVDDESAVRDYRVSIKPAQVGPKFGAKMNELRTALAALDPVEVVRRVGTNKMITIAGVELLSEDIGVQVSDKVGFAVAEDSSLVVAVTTELTRELELEGLARELVRQIQIMRKNANLKISDRIITYYQHATPDFDAMLAKHGLYVGRETLTVEFVKTAIPPNAFVQKIDFNDGSVDIGIMREEKTSPRNVSRVKQTKKSIANTPKS